MLPEKFKEPSGFQWGTFTSGRGAQIRYGSLQVDNPKGTIVITTGFRELIEKYFEVAHEMTALGFSVWLMDWRGQGGSERFLKDKPQRVHCEGYEDHIATLHQFTQKIISKSSGLLVLLTHSMGGHIGLRYMKEHPDVFDSAIMTSPMFDIRIPPALKPAARGLARFAKIFNFIEYYVPFGRDWSEADEVFAGNSKTSDPGRFVVLGEIFREKPALKMGGPTYGWAYSAFESIKILNQESYLKGIQAPILMGISGDDAIVDKAAEETACRLLPHCAQFDAPAAKHELWMERDELRAPWMAKVAAFLERRATGIKL